MRRLLLTLLTLTTLTAAARQPAPGNGSAPPAAAGGTAPAEGGGAPPAQAAPAQPSQDRYMGGMGRTPEEEARLRELSADLQRYEEESRDFRREVQLLVERKYEEKRNGLAASYEKVIGELEICEMHEARDQLRACTWSCRARRVLDVRFSSPRRLVAPAFEDQRASHSRHRRVATFRRIRSQV